MSAAVGLTCILQPAVQINQLDSAAEKPAAHTCNLSGILRRGSGSGTKDIIVVKDQPASFISNYYIFVASGVTALATMHCFIFISTINGNLNDFSSNARNLDISWRCRKAFSSTDVLTLMLIKLVIIVLISCTCFPLATSVVKNILQPAHSRISEFADISFRDSRVKRRID